MVEEPVAITWDGNARMYVAEMLTYMQDANAIGERLPTSRIVMLEDTNNDGKMDKRSVFIENLMLPRMMLRGPRNGPSPFITPLEVSKVRIGSGDRATSWTLSELEKLVPEPAKPSGK